MENIENDPQAQFFLTDPDLEKRARKAALNKKVSLKKPLIFLFFNKKSIKINKKSIILNEIH